jgi:hypothetical protein
MIEKIIRDGNYTFKGDVKDFKQQIRNLKITKVITEGECLGIEMFDAIGKFKYKGMVHEIQLSLSWDKEKSLFIEYLGGE